MTTTEQPEATGTATHNAEKPEPKLFHIQIDREHYKISEEKVSGAELRRVPCNPIPPDRDIFQVVPGHDDRKIKDDDTVEVYDGLRFFTVPNTINPGGSTACIG